MRTRFILSVLIALPAMLAAGKLNAKQTTNQVVLTIHKTEPTNGKAMYASYCAVCHGVEARGNGPVASELTTPPPDLTMQSRNNHGRYPEAHIAAVLRFGARPPAHGSAVMPVWGSILGKMDQANPEETLLRISNLSRYLQSIQAK